MLAYKDVDALGVAIIDPIRATTPLFSAMMAIIFLGEQITLPIIVATLMIIAGITLLSWRSGSMKLAGSAVYPWYPVVASALAGATRVVRKFGMAAVPHPFLAAEECAVDAATIRAQKAELGELSGGAAIRSARRPVQRLVKPRRFVPRDRGLAAAAARRVFRHLAEKAS